MVTFSPNFPSLTAPFIDITEDHIQLWDNLTKLQQIIFRYPEWDMSPILDGWFRVFAGESLQIMLDNTDSNKDYCDEVLSEIVCRFNLN